MILFACIEQDEVMALTAPHGDAIETPDQRFYGSLHGVPMLGVSWIAHAWLDMVGKLKYSKYVGNVVG